MVSGFSHSLYATPRSLFLMKPTTDVEHKVLIIPRAQKPHVDTPVAFLLISIPYFLLLHIVTFAAVRLHDQILI
jgi:hypothetical protein